MEVNFQALPMVPPCPDAFGALGSVVPETVVEVYCKTSTGFEQNRIVRDH